MILKKIKVMVLRFILMDSMKKIHKNAEDKDKKRIFVPLALK